MFDKNAGRNFDAPTKMYLAVMNVRVAIIDLGTNTFHLLIADIKNGKYFVTYTEKIPVKIGKGGINQGLITLEGKERAIKALLSFKEKIESKGCEKIVAFGTSALRSAANGLEIIKEINEQTGIHVRIISGEEEASFIYEGVRWAVNLGKTRALIIDIGGGSVEFMIADENELFWKKSYEIGAQRLLEMFHKHDPITIEEIATLNIFFEQSLKEVFEQLNKYAVSVLVGSSGTFDTLSEIHCKHYGIPYSSRQSETAFTIESFHKIHQELITKNREERLSIPGMIEMRVDMIVTASCLIKYILQRHSFEKIRVSSYSLKEGVLISLCRK